MKKFVSVLIMVALLSGCASMTKFEADNYRELEDLGAECDKVADPGAAAILNVLPGFGDIYLASGNGANSSNWGAFVLDLLFWPVSVVWAIPQGGITATNINKKECVGYYHHTTRGKKALKELQAEHEELEG